MSSFTALWMVPLLAGSAANPIPATPVISRPAWIASARHLASDKARISVWLNQQDPFHRGDRAQVYIKADRDSYVTVLRIDTDGRVRVLFPIDPDDDNFARGGQAFEVLGRDGNGAFDVNDAPGQGYVFAISSTDPFTYDGLVTSGHWDYRTIADGRVREDPYVAVTDLAAQIAPDGSWDYDMASYDVEQHYDYPRFVCYDCHAYASYWAWNPYDHFCSQYRIVIYDDPYYYPYRYYGTAVVYPRPLHPGPRYVFRDYNASSPYVSREPFRPRGSDGRSIPDRGRTGVDVGGRGSVSIPVGGGGRRPDPRNRNPYDRPGTRDGDGHGDGGGHDGDHHGGDDNGHHGGGDDNGHHNGGDRPRGRDDDGHDNGGDNGHGRGGNDGDHQGQGHRPERRGDQGWSGGGQDRPSTGSNNGGQEQRPIRRGGEDHPSAPDNRSGPDRRPAIEPRPPQSQGRAEPRRDDRPQHNAEPRSAPRPSAQSGSSSPPSRATGAPELRRRKP